MSKLDANRWNRIKELFAAALELDRAARPSFLTAQCGSDFELRAELDSLLEAHHDAQMVIERPAFELAFDMPPAPSWVGRHLGPYRATAEIGRGGMSEVYTAVREDDEYQVEVAVKVLRRGYETDSLLRRFRTEKQILATLDHPNIARLLDGGCTEEGLPYLVMDYVRGQPIDAYCAERALEIGSRLTLFISLCAAVQFVHQHLMVHGDLKCANVLVAENGEVKLLDFGIARLLQPAASPRGGTASPTTLIALTPEYASPEQIRGDPLTTASDVYSLGVVLFRLLTGILPPRDARAVFCEESGGVCEEQPPLPSEVARRRGVGPTGEFWRQLRGDLDNIVRFALHADPAKRYQTVEQFSEDLRRYLGGRPVIAHPPSFSYRATKFLRRNRLLAGAAVLLFASLAAGMVATRWQAQLANMQRARAERHFNGVRRLAHDLMFDIHDSIVDIPGSGAARTLLVHRALEYVGKLSEESRDDIPLLEEIAAAYQRIGDLQGDPRNGETRADRAEALQSYGKSLAIRTRLAATQPTSLHTRQLAETHRLVGRMLLLNGDSEGASQHLQAAIEADHVLQ